MAADTQWRRLTLLMIVICPECGGKNRIPDTPDTGKTYRCFGCKAILALAAEAVATDGVRGLDVPLGGGLRPATLPLSKPRSSRMSLGAVLARLQERERLLIGLLALTVLAVHLFIVPFRGDTFVYDEAWYIPAAQSVVEGGEVLVAEHPPLGKLLIALGIGALGDNEWGWRVPSVLFGAVLVVVFYYVSRELVGRSAAFLAVGLFAFETLIFTFSGLAMLIVFSATFMSLSFLFYLRGHYVLSGVFLALSGLCRLTGLLGAIVIVVHWLVMRRKVQSPRAILNWAISVVVAFMVLMALFDFVTFGEWQNPVDRASHMLTFYRAQTWDTMSGYAAAQAPPWMWILNPVGFLWPGHLAYAQISPTVWIMIIPSMGYLAHELIRRRSEVSVFALTWLVATCLVWIPVVIIMGRVTYQYYFFPTVGAVCLAIGYVVKRLWDASSQGTHARHGQLIRGAITAYFVLHLLAFLFLTPLLWALDSHIGFLR